MFTLESAKNLIWENAAHTLFRCESKLAEMGEYLPMSADANDPYQHIQDLWKRGLSGEFGQIAEFIDPLIATQPQPSSSGVQTI